MRCTLLLLLALTGAVNPITRVAELLEGMAKKVKEDGKNEQDLYDKFKCWCDTVLKTKAESVETNAARITELAAYVDDLTNGRVELTSERTDTEAEISALEKAIAEADAMRQRENEDFVAAKDEMDMAVRALDKALTTLSVATADQKDGGVLSEVKSELGQVLTTGGGFLSKRTVDLKKLLEVPNADWNKLNGAATHKMEYAARSTKIQDILRDMYNTFVDNRDEAVENERKAVSDYTTLTDAKKGELRAAKAALMDKAKENGARDLAKGEANSEKNDLETQNTRDTKFMRDTQSTCQTRAGEWDTRKDLRAQEVASIGEAIGVLRDDDARDLFSKSMDSQSLLQVEARRIDHRRERALAALSVAAAKSSNARLSVLVTQISMMRQAPEAQPDVNADPFREIFTSMDTMVSGLRSEESEDLRNKEYCESERNSNSQEAKMFGKKIDTNVETLDRLDQQVTDANTRITEINNEIADLRTQKQDAGTRRGEENIEFLSSKKDDEDAIALVETAMGVLQKFYTDNGLNLAQTKSKVVRAHQPGGVAPDAPPSTWDSGYGGAKGENEGVIGMMEIIKRDINKDITTAGAEETKSVTEYGDLCDDIDDTIEALQGSRGTLEGKVGTDMGLAVTERGTKTSNEGELTAALDFLKQIAPGCDFIAINFNTRMTNRQAEMDGLQKAKAILGGAA